MPFSTPGSSITQRIVFNSGTVDFGSNRLVDVENISLSVAFETAPLYVLNSIKPQDLVRHSQKVDMTAKIKSFSPELESVTWGASSAGTPNVISTLDGQATLQSPVVTLFDRNGKQVQYQFSGAVVKSSKLTANMEAYAEWDFEIDAKDIVLLYES